MSDSYEGCQLNDHEPGKSSLATDEHGFTRINNWLYQFFVTPFGLSASLAQHNVLSVFIGVNLWLTKFFRFNKVQAQSAMAPVPGTVANPSRTSPGTWHHPAAPGG